MDNNSEIQLVVVPKIVHKLQEVGVSVVKRLTDLNIDKLVATEDTVKSLKNLRTDLTKELGNFEEQRKLVKNGILNPYNEFEAVYKTEISERYTKAIATLKDKVDAVETKVKDEKKASVKRYFDELCLSEKIDFLTFEKVGLEINLSTSEKAYKEQCLKFVEKTVDDIALIRTTDFEAEILTEYKNTLNASKAITTVKDRKEAEKLEAERIRRASINKNIEQVKASGLVYDEFSRSYLYSNSIFITEDFINNSSNGDFSSKLIEVQEQIKASKQADKLAESSNEEAHLFSSVQEKPKPEVLSAPAVKIAEKVTASFEVVCSMEQLRSLGQYMRTNNITYKNI